MNKATNHLPTKRLYTFFTVILLLTTGILLPTQLMGQPSKIDSLKNVLTTAKDTVKSNTLMKLADQYMYSQQWEEAIASTNKALEWSKKIKYKDGEAKAHYKLGYISAHTSNITEALVSLRKAYELHEELENPAGQITALNSTGSCYKRQGNYDTALQCYEKALLLSKAIQNKKRMAQLISNIALIYKIQGNTTKALDNQLESLKIFEQLGDMTSAAINISSIGNLYLGQYNYDLALQYFKRSIAINDSLGIEKYLPQALLNIGRVYQDLNELDKAKEHYEKSLALREKNNDKVGQSQANRFLGSLHLQKGQQYLPLAIQYLEKALKLAEELGTKGQISVTYLKLAEAYELSGQLDQAITTSQKAMQLSEEMSFAANIMDIAKTMSRLYAKKQQFEKAYDYHRLFKSKSDSLYNTNNVKEITQLEEKYKYEKEKQTILAQQEKEELIYESEIKRRQVLLYSALAIGILFLILFINFYRSFRVKKKDNLLLLEQNNLISEQKEELAQQSEELQAINDKLHELSQFKDGFTHMVAHDMKTPLSNIITITEDVSEKKYARINLDGKQLLHMITNMLEIQKFEEAAPQLDLEDTNAHYLIEEAWGSVSLLAQTKSVSLQYNAKQDCVLHVDCDMMLRVLTNLFSNAIKYAPSSSMVAVSLVVLDDGQALITVTDQGMGIQKEHLVHVFDRFWQAKAVRAGVAKSTGLGLAYCKLAVEAHQGTINVTSQVGIGTSFFVYLPIKAVIDVEIRAEKSTPEPAIIAEEEAATILQFAERFKQIKIYQASDLVQTLSEMDHLALKSGWKSEITSAIYHGNKERYQQLVDMACNTY